VFNEMMEYFVVIIVVGMIVQVCSFNEQTHQVTLSCPSRAELERGPAGVPGKRGSKGEPGSMGENISFKYFMNKITV